MASPENIGSMSGKELSLRVFQDAVGNVFFYGIACFVIWLIGSHLRWLGLSLFAIYALLEAWSLVHFIFTVGVGLIAPPMILYETWKTRRIFFRTEIREQLLTAVAHGIRIVEQCFHVAYFLVLYHFYFMQG